MRRRWAMMAASENRAMPCTKKRSRACTIWLMYYLKSLSLLFFFFSFFLLYIPHFFGRFTTWRLFGRASNTPSGTESNKSCSIFHPLSFNTKFLFLKIFSMLLFYDGLYISPRFRFLSIWLRSKCYRIRTNELFTMRCFVEKCDSIFCLCICR